jgi:hypothetical protein
MTVHVSIVLEALLACEPGDEDKAVHRYLETIGRAQLHNIPLIISVEGVVSDVSVKRRHATLQLGGPLNAALLRVPRRRPGGA